MSPTAIDLFELLDVARRENSYSSLLQQLLQRSPRLRQRVLDHGFGGSGPVLTNAEVRLRRSLPGKASVLDLLVAGDDAQGQRWELFIENKIDAKESAGQTKRYLDACRDQVGTRAAGIYLTLDGHRPQAVGVAALSHGTLGEWVEAFLPEIGDPVLRMVAETYVRRARIPPPTFSPDVGIGHYLEAPIGLLSPLAGVAVLGQAVVQNAPGWRHTALVIQGRGHANPGLQFRRDGWVGQRISGQRFSRENYNVHGELELVPHGGRRLKLHFETEPYHKKREVKSLRKSEDFEAMRTIFHRSIRERARQLPGWTMKSGFLQVCAYELKISATSRAGDVVAKLAKALEAIGPVAEQALRIAKG